MKKSFRKGLLVLALLLTCATVGVGVAVRDTETIPTSATVDIIDEEIKSDYGIGTTFIMPESVTGKYGEEEKTFTNGVLIFPDGTAYSEKEIAMTKEGVYTLRYTFKTETGVVCAEKDITVSKKNWTLSSSNSTAVYSEAMETVKYVSNTETTQLPGLQVSLASGDTFTYNKPIDLSDTTLQEVIRLSSFNHEYTEKGTDESGAKTYDKEYIAQNCLVTLTDCYNPDIYVTLVMNFNNQGTPYFRVGSSSQLDIGLEKNDQIVNSAEVKSVIVDGIRYKAWSSQKYGTWQGLPSLSHKTPILKVGYGWVVDYATHRWTCSGVLINNLTHENIYGENIFEGFTTGEVYLSITGDQYFVNKPLRLEIVSIGHEQGEALKETDTKDTKAPIIVLNEQVANAENVYCAVGDSFPVPNASAIDVNLVDGVKVKVYKNYGTAKQTEVLVKDGKFTPNAAAIYTIVYSAQDATGNVAERTLNVTVFKAEDGRSIALDVEKLTSLDAGKPATLPQYSLSGYNGQTNLKISVEYGGESQEIALDNMQFTPLHVGEYTVVYEYWDIFFSYRYEYKVNSVASDAIAMIEQPIMPRYYIKGQTYSLDTYSVYSFTETDPKPLTADVFASFDGGAYAKIEDTKEFTVTGNETVTFQYRYKDKDIGAPITVPVIDVTGKYIGEKEEEIDDIWLFKYFVGDFTIASTVEKDLTFNTVAGTGDKTLSFINPVSASNFRLIFSVPEGRDNFSAMHIVLTDYYDADNKTVISYEKEGGNVYYRIDGGERVLLKDAFASAVTKTVYYDNANRLMRHAEGSDLYYFDFTSDKCYLDIVFTNCTGASSIVVKQIGNAQLRNATHEDKTNPYISVFKNRGNRLLGTETTVYGAEVIDVLSSVLSKTITVSVIDPDGRDVTSKDGVVLSKVKPVDGTRDYVIELTKKGTYTVTYTGKDTANKIIQTSYAINVYSDVAPTITFDNGYTQDTVIKAKEGQTISLPKYTLSDDAPVDEITVTVMLVGELDGTLYPYVDEETSVKLLGKGYYRMYVIAVDADGNIGYNYYRILAE